ncbi:MAG: hypothetical protein O7G85_09470 [Planctomycetota bacterium]|nr:hypothetical protein [Planctomycetota bacterium]
MTSQAHWRELYRCEDLSQVSMVHTCLLSMEYDVALLDGAGRQGPFPDDSNHAGPYVIQVPSEHWPELNEVLYSIIEEQMEFDVYLAAWPERANRWKRHFLLVLVAIVTILAIFGLIDL